jgi:hypothetical protein
MLYYRVCRALGEFVNVRTPSAVSWFCDRRRSLFTAEGSSYACSIMTS